MLYGVRPGLQRSIAAEGYKVLVAVAVRPGLVPVPHAPARRAPGESRVLPQEPRPPMSVAPQRLPTSSSSAAASSGRASRSTSPRPASTSASLERDQLAGGSTSRAAGGIRAQFSDPLNIAIGLRSIEAFTRFGERPGAEIDLHQVGYLFLLDRAEDVARLRGERRAPERARRPEPLRRRSTRSRELCPLAGLDGVLAATFCPLDGHASPEAVVQGYAAGARRHGATVLTGCAVTGVERRRRRDPRRRDDASARSRPGRSSARPASGRRRSRARSASSFPSSRTCARSDSPARPTACPSAFPLTIDFSTGFYFHREGPGLLFGMADRDAAAGLRRADRSQRGSRRSWRSPSGGCPSLLDMGIAGGWKGYYEVTPDHNALVGEAPERQPLPLRDGLLGPRLPARPGGRRDRPRPRPRTRARSSTSRPLSVERFARAAARPERNVI